MSTDLEALQRRLDESRELNRYAEHTRDVLIPELHRLSVPWRYFAWRKLYKEVKSRNAHVQQELDRRVRV